MSCPGVVTFSKFPVSFHRKFGVIVSSGLYIAIGWFMNPWLCGVSPEYFGLKMFLAVAGESTSLHYTSFDARRIPGIGPKMRNGFMSAPIGMLFFQKLLKP
jgi:hypothetical protein